MSITLETYRDVFGGNLDRRVRALMLMALSFAVGGYLASNVFYYFPHLDSTGAAALCGAVFAALFSLVRFR